MGAILPIVSLTPNDLVAANVMTGLTEYVGMFVGPLATALLLVDGTPALVFAVCAAVVGAGALLSSRLRLLQDHLPDALEIDAGGVIANCSAASAPSASTARCASSSSSSGWEP